MSLFSLKREKKGDREILRLEGAITGDAGLEFIKLYDGISPKCTFNFRNVISINSQGLQVWTMFLRDFVNDHEVQLEECPPVIVSQMNMLPSFVQKAKVTSIYVPYFCQACNKVNSLIMEARQFPKGDQEMKPPACPTCKGEQELDDFDYFFFLSYLNDR